MSVGIRTNGSDPSGMFVSRFSPGLWFREAAVERDATRRGSASGSRTLRKRVVCRRPDCQIGRPSRPRLEDLGGVRGPPSWSRSDVTEAAGVEAGGDRGWAGSRDSPQIRSLEFPTPASVGRGPAGTAVLNRLLAHKAPAARRVRPKSTPAACAQVADHFRRHGSRPFQWSNDLQPHAPKPTDTPGSAGAPSTRTVLVSAAFARASKSWAVERHSSG
jgi:hypothetical protein